MKQPHETKKLIKEVQGWVEATHPNAEHMIRTGYWVKGLFYQVLGREVEVDIVPTILRGDKECRLKMKL